MHSRKGMEQPRGVHRMAADSDGAKEKQEQAQKYEAKLRKEFTVSEESSSEALAIQEMGRKLEGNTRHKGKIRYYVVHHGTKNAFAVGNSVYIHSGLISMLDSEDEVASVLAHEITHVEGGDTERGYDGSSFYERISRKRAQEVIADAVQPKLVAAGYNPKSVGVMLGKLTKMQREQESGGGLTHGDGVDRQLGAEAHLHIKDYGEAGAQEFQKKRAELTDATLLPKSALNSYEKIVDLSEKKETEALAAFVESFDTDFIIECFWNLSSQGHRLMWELRDTTVKPLEPAARPEKEAKLTAVVAAMVAVDDKLNARIKAAFPEQSERELKHTKTIALFENSSSSAGTLDELQRFTKGALPFTLKNVVDDFDSKEDIMGVVAAYKGRSEIIDKLVLEATKDSSHHLFSHDQGLLARTVYRFIPMTGEDSARMFSFVYDVASAIRSPHEISMPFWTEGTGKRIHETLLNSILHRAFDAMSDEGDFAANFENMRPRLLEEMSEADVSYEEFQTRLGKKLTSGIIGPFLHQIEMRIRQGASRFYHEASDMGNRFYEDLITKTAEVRARRDALIGKVHAAAFAPDRESRMQFFKEFSRDEISDVLKRIDLRRLISNHDVQTRFQNDLLSYLLTEFVPLPEDVEYVNVYARRALGRLKIPSRTAPQFSEREVAFLSAIHFYAIFDDDGMREKTLSAVPEKASSPEAALVILSSYFHYSRGIGFIVESIQSPALQGLLTQAAPLFEGHNARDISAAIQELSTQVMQGSYMRTSKRKETGRFKKIEDMVTNFLEPLYGNLLSRVKENDNEDTADYWIQLIDALGTSSEDDNRQQSQQANVLAHKGIEKLSYEEGKRLLKHCVSQGIFAQDAIDVFLERKVRDFAQHEEVSGDVEKLVAHVHVVGADSVGKAVLLDFMSGEGLRMHKNPEELLIAGLESKTDDSELRAILAPMWYAQYGVSYERGGRSATAEEMFKTFPERFYGFTPFEDFMDSFYAGLTEKEVDVVLRKLLLGPNGALHTDVGRKAIHEFITKNIVSSDSAFLSLLTESAEAGLSSIDPVRLYLPLRKLFKDKIFLKPEVRGGNQKAVERLLDSRLRFNNPTDEEKAYVADLCSFRLPTENKGLAEDVQRAPSLLELQRFVESKTGKIERGTSTEDIQALDAVLMTAESMGAVGVRFLQLLSQYVAIPTEYQEAFDNMHDSVRGQSKWTAMHTLKREAENGSAPAFKKFFAGITDFGESIGGGSLMTVYKVISDGKPHAVKVLNPNVEGFIADNIRDAKNILTKLGVGRFPFAEVLLNDLEGWLRDDINSKRKLMERGNFGDVHPDEEITLDSGEKVMIRVPKRLHTRSKHILIQEFVEGETLSRKITRGDDDAAKYVEAFSKHYEQRQLRHFAQDGLTRIHSDAHAGNIIVGKDGNLYIIDYEHTLDTSRSDMRTFGVLTKGTKNPIVAARAVSHIFDLTSERAEQQRLGPLRKARLAQGIAKDVLRIRRERKDVSVGDSVLEVFRNRGLALPIRFSLLLRNQHSLRTMATRTESK